MIKIIIKDIPAVDWPVAIRAARWLLDRPDQKDAVLVFGPYGEDKMCFYVVRNKSSITVRNQA
jgi:hypothetical protein